jgi:hypothetical protein
LITEEGKSITGRRGIDNRGRSITGEEIYNGEESITERRSITEWD